MSAPENPRLALDRKLLAIRRALKSLPKNGYNAHHGYHFARSEDAVAKLRRLLDEHELLLIPSVDGEVEHHGTLTSVPLSYTFVDVETGQERSVSWHGEGFDKGGDKGIWKAYTGALKYLIIDFFQVKVSRDDPEDDHVTGAAGGRSSGPPRIPRDRATRIRDAAKDAGMDATAFGALLADVTDGRISQAGKVGALNVNEAEAVEAALKAEAKP